MSRGTECAGKLAHSTPEAAGRHRQRRIEGGAAPESVKVYPCRWCHHWHVGTPGAGTNGRSAPHRRRGRRK